MRIEGYQYKKKKEAGLDCAGMLREFEACQDTLSQHDLELGMNAMRQVLAAADEFERMHPRIAHPERRRQFEHLTALAQDLADTLGLDFSARIDDQMTGHLSLCGDCLLLDREYGAEFLEMLQQLISICEQYYITPVQQYGEMLMCMSFVVPLYVRKA